jgi:GH24 family phage-related lysozyme (muramidase)
MKEKGLIQALNVGDLDRALDIWQERNRSRATGQKLRRLEERREAETSLFLYGEYQ